MKLAVNQGPTEQLVRVAIGVVLLDLAATDWIDGPALYLALGVGAIAFMTGLSGHSPAYRLLRIHRPPGGDHRAGDGAP